MNAWPHQIRGINGTLDAIARGVHRVLLQSPTGMGKTYQMKELAKRYHEAGKKVSIYTNRKMLLDQLSASFLADGIYHGIRAAGHEPELDHPIQISSIQTEYTRCIKRKRWELHEAELVLTDECFVGETMILTTSGYRRIDNMRSGDKVYTAAGIGGVEIVSCRLASELYLLEMSNGSSITCTGNHRIFTGNGWIAARSMALGDVVFCPETVRLLWENMGAKTHSEKRKTLHSWQNDMGEADVLLSILREEIEEPNEQSSGIVKDEGKAQRDQTQTTEARRQRAIAALASISSSACSRGWMGIGTFDSYQNAKRERLSNSLQNRHRKPSAIDRNRSGWKITRNIVKAGARCQKNGIASQARVVNISRVERKSPTPVFNLHVDGHPSYFANGWLVHNCHLQKADAARKLLGEHHAHGAACVGFSATPFDLAELYDEMVIAGTVSEGRQCGALVTAMHYGPDEPDLVAHKKLVASLESSGTITEEMARKAMKPKVLFGRILEWFNKLNPDHAPSLLFAPGVRESIWFAQEFSKRGIRAAHIDGEEVWVDGEMHETSRKIRNEVIAASKSGDIKVICNRFVMREGIDLPWLRHCIMATIFGSLQSYLQSGGRMLRAYPGLDHVTIQDHGGNWWKWGSLNADRHWELNYTTSMGYALRADRIRNKEERPPTVCPNCKRIINTRNCPCGHVLPSMTAPRAVLTTDGKLREIDGAFFKERQPYTAPDGPELWRKMYHRSCSPRGRRTFRAAAALFAYENGWSWPQQDWPLMPTDPQDWFRQVPEVPKERLKTT